MGITRKSVGPWRQDGAEAVENPHGQKKVALPQASPKVTPAKIIHRMWKVMKRQSDFSSPTFWGLPLFNNMTTMQFFKLFVSGFFGWVNHPWSYISISFYINWVLQMVFCKDQTTFPDKEASSAQQMWQKQGRTQPQYLKNTCLAGLQHGKNHRCLQVGRDGKPNQKLGRPVMWNGKSSSVWQIRCCLEIQKTQGNRLISGFCSWVGAPPISHHHLEVTTSGPLVELMPCYAMPLGPKKAGLLGWNPRPSF